MKHQAHPYPSSGGPIPVLCATITSALLITCIHFSSKYLVLSSGISIPKPNKRTSITWNVDPQKENTYYAEANAQVPENKPEDTNLFSFKEQQAANPIQSDSLSKSSTPRLDGSERNFKIIKKQPPENKVQGQQKIQNINILNPSSLEVLKRPKSSNSEGIRIQSFNRNQNNGQIALSKSQSKGLENETHQKNPLKLAKRRKVDPTLTNGPIMNSPSLAPRVGSLAIECKLHPYGVYLQQMLKSIEEQWGQLVRGSISYIRKEKLPGKITLQFKLTSEGQVTELRRIDLLPINSLATDLCRQAISSRSPFGKWSQEMIHDLGDSDIVTISFIYH